MALDLRIDFQNRDLTLSPVSDLAIAQGDDLVRQRVLIRLIVERGTFEYDPTGTLGSRIMLLARATGINVFQAVDQAVREALEPMADIRVVAVNAAYALMSDDVTEDKRTIRVEVRYVMVENQASPGDEQTTGDVFIPLV